MSTHARSTRRPDRPSSPDADPTRYVPDELVEAFTVIDPDLVRRLKADREATGLDRRDEMWEGVYVVSPDPNSEHQRFIAKFLVAFSHVCDPFAGGELFPGGNVSDRADGWHKNYRIPDVAVYLPGNPSRDLGTHRVGGPDFAIEILSKHDQARKKLAFYAEVGTRELLFVDRDPWSLELFRLIEGRLELVGKSTPRDPAILASQVLPLTFRLVEGPDRPMIEINRPEGGQVWRI